MTTLDDWCTTCRQHRAPHPGGQCPICAPTPDDLLQRIDRALAAEDQAPAGRHQSSDAASPQPANHRPQTTSRMCRCTVLPYDYAIHSDGRIVDRYGQTIDLGLTRQENRR